MEQINGMKFTELDIDCLEAIFQYLSIEDLLNVADSNKVLKQAADLTFQLKHGKSTLLIQNKFFPYNWCDGFKGGEAIIDSRCLADLIEQDWPLRPKHLKETLQILRCFGHKISILMIRIPENIHIQNSAAFLTSFGHIVTYIKDYCIETLKQLYIESKAGGTLALFEKQFPNVHSVFVQSSDVSNFSLNDIFPQMSRLTYCKNNSCKVSDFIDIQKHFPKLKNFEIAVDSASSAYEIIPSIQGVIRLNPQIQSLTVPFIDENIHFQNINEVLPNLTELNLLNYCRNIENSSTYHFKTVKRFLIQWPKHSYEKFSYIPFSFENLEELTFDINSKNTLNEKFYDFILKNSSISKLQIKYQQEINLSKLISIMPCITELNLSHCYLTVDGVVEFMNKNPTLKTILFSLHDSFICKITDIKIRLNDKWHGIRSPLLCKRPVVGPYKFTRTQQ